MTRTETKGNPPNYYTLHCPCGGGFIWRTDDENGPRLEWLRTHGEHDIASACAWIDAIIAKTVALAVTFGLAYGAWWLAT